MEEKTNPTGTAERSFGEISEQSRKGAARRFGFNKVNPEVGTAGVIMVPSIHLLEAVS